MVIGPDNYLDLWNIIVNEIIGSPFLAWCIGMLVIIAFTNRIAMRWSTSFILISFWCIIFAYQLGQTAIAAASLILIITFLSWRIATTYTD